jgi:hypothetical protein
MVQSSIVRIEDPVRLGPIYSSGKNIVPKIEDLVRLGP